MSLRNVSVFIGVLGLWTGTGSAATPVAQGTIAFTGSIVEPGCATNARSGGQMDLIGCPSANRGGAIDVRSMRPVASVADAHVQLVADSANGRYYDQRYRLGDSAGKPIQSGNYVITLTSP